MDAPPPGASVQTGTDRDLIESLRAGDEATFAQLVRAWSPAMLRLARNFVSTSQSAEDAVQDAWLGMLNGLDRFEGRASLRTWTFSILVNRAKSRGVRESRTVVDLRVAEDDGNGRPTVDPERFQGPGRPVPGRVDPGGCAAAVASTRKAGGRAGNPRAHRAGARGPARPAATRRHDARRAGPQRRRSVRPARCVAGQPTHPAAPRPRRPTRRARGLLPCLTEHAPPGAAAIL